MNKIVCPVVHLNGTSRTDLMQQIEDAYDACRNLLTKLKAAAPNPRDYYPVSGLMDKALEQHNRRMKVVTDLMTELEEQASQMS